MSGKNSKFRITLGLLTTIFLFCTIQLAFVRFNWLLHDSVGFFTRFNWLFSQFNWLFLHDSIDFFDDSIDFFDDSIGFFCPTQLAFFIRLNWLFLSDSIDFFDDSIGFFLTTQLAFFNSSLDYYPNLKPIYPTNYYPNLKSQFSNFFLKSQFFS